MVRALHLGAYERVDLLVTRHIRTRLNLARAISIESRLREDLTREPHAGAHFSHIVRVAHIVEEDLRLVVRISRSEAHPAATARAHRAGVRLKAMLFRQRRAIVGDGE